MRLGIKLNCDKIRSEYAYEYKNKLNLNDDREDLYYYLFGYWPSNDIMYKIRNNENKYMLYFHNEFITTLNNIFKDKC